MGNPSQSCGASLAIGNHAVLPATRHKWTCPTITPANQASTRFTYPGGMEGWVDLGSLIVAWPGIELTTAWSQVRHPNRYATESPMFLLKCNALSNELCRSLPMGWTFHSWRQVQRMQQMLNRHFWRWRPRLNVAWGQLHLQLLISDLTLKSMPALQSSRPVQAAVAECGLLL